MTMSVGPPIASIPITRRHHLLSFSQFLEAEGISVTSVAKRLGLPFWHNGEPDDWIPLRDTMHFFQEFERATSALDLGVTISECENTVSKSTFSRFLDNSPTLFHALKKLCIHAKQHTSLAHLWLEEAGAEVLLCRANYDEINLGLRQHEQYVIGFCTRLVGYAAGFDWRPRLIWTSAPGQFALKETNSFAECEVSTGRPYTVISIPKALISKDPGFLFKTGGSDTLGRVTVAERDPAGSDFPTSLCQIMVTLLKEHAADLETVAEILRMHPRTLQRRLRYEGSSFRKVLDEARFRLATELMHWPGATVTEVSRSLGYSTVANFSRSFKRIAGVTPGEYIKLHIEKQ